MVVQNTGKRVVLQVDGSVEVCRVTISRYLNAPVRVGSSYRLEYYFIYFPVVVQTQGSVLSSKWTVVWNLAYRLLPCLLLIGTLPAGSPFPGTYKQCASKSRLRYRVEYYFIYFPVVVQTQGSVLSSKWTVVWKSPGSPFPGTYKQCASKSRLWL